MTRALEILTAFALGLLAGAMLLIGAAIVPYWRSLDPAAVGPWFAQNAPFLGGVMVPLGGGTTLLALVTATATWRAGRSTRGAFAVAALLALAVAGIYLIEHASLNARLAAGGLDAAEVEAALERWRAWHGARTGAGALAFLAALLGLRRAGSVGRPRVRLPR